MDTNAMFLIVLHLGLLPVVFNGLKYLRLEELFKRRTPPQFIGMFYVILSIAITQLVLTYVINLYGLVEGLL